MATKHQSHGTKPSKWEKCKKTINPNFPLPGKMLAKDFDAQTVEHSSSRNSFESWKIVEHIQNELPR